MTVCLFTFSNISIKKSTKLLRMGNESCSDGAGVDKNSMSPDQMASSDLDLHCTVFKRDLEDIEDDV